MTGIFLASPPVDFATHDTYFVVAHFHSVLFGSRVRGIRGIYFWYPKITGRMMRERLGKASFWFMFIGFERHLRSAVPGRAAGHAATGRGVRRD